MYIKSAAAKLWLYSLFVVLLCLTAAKSVRAANDPTADLSPQAADAGATTDITFIGHNSDFNASTSLYIVCQGGGESDITVNSISVASSTEMTANITIASSTRCLRVQSEPFPFRYHDIHIYEHGPDDPLSYQANGQLEVKNTSISVNKANDGVALFSTIYEGIVEATPGDTVLVDAGEYHEIVELNKDNIHLKAQHGPASTSIIYDSCDFTVLMDNNSGTTIDGFSVLANQDNCSSGIYIENTNNHSVTNMIIGPNLQKDFFLAGTSYGINNNVIERNIFQGQYNRLDFQLDSLDATIFRLNSLNNSVIFQDTSLSATSSPNFSNIFSQNYWGDPSGPQNKIFNPIGTGASLASGFFFKNWCAAADCQQFTDASLRLSDIRMLFDSPVAYDNNWLLRAPAGTVPSSTPSLTAIQQIELIIPTAGASSTIAIPAGTLIERTDKLEFDASELSNAAMDIKNLSGFDNLTVVGQAIQWGLPNIGLTFSQPILVSLYAGNSLEGQTLNILHSNSTNSNWNANGLSSPNCIISAGFCRFTTTQASYFATAIATAKFKPNDNNDATSGPSAGNNTIIIIPMQKNNSLATEKGTSTDQSMSDKPSVKSAPGNEKPKITTGSPKKKILGQKIIRTATLLRNIVTKKIYVLADNKKRAVRTLQELRKKYAGVKIYDLPGDLLNNWKDI